MGVLNNLVPEKVFYYFEELCNIPHGSKNTKAISDYCVNFAKERGLAYHQDAFAVSLYFYLTSTDFAMHNKSSFCKNISISFFLLYSPHCNNFFSNIQRLCLNGRFYDTFGYKSINVDMILK